MRSALTLFWLLTATLGAGAGQAQDAPVVVELFTSQGCSSCPPADEILQDIAALDGVIALALHVDYWDYIGWKDVFARPEFTARQQSYAIAAGERSVYTPQMIVGGVDPVVGADAMHVMALIRAHAMVPHDVVLDVSRRGDRLLIRATAPIQRAMMVQLVRYDLEETVTIDRGENAGRTVQYVNIVTSWDRIGDWTGAEPFVAEVDVAGPSAVVVIVQEQGPGRILAAAQLP
jgi:hypothetical protein